MNTSKLHYPISAFMPAMYPTALLQDAAYVLPVAPYMLRQTHMQVLMAVLPKESSLDILRIQKDVRLRDASPAERKKAREHTEVKHRVPLHTLLDRIARSAETVMRHTVYSRFSDAVRDRSRTMKVQKFINLPAFYAGTVRPDLIVKKVGLEVLVLSGMQLLLDHMMLDMHATGDADMPKTYATRTLEQVRQMHPSIFAE